MDVLAQGVDFVGINLYQPSPRSVTQAEAEALLSAIPVGKRVMVDVMPSLDKVRWALGSGFDALQIHGDIDALLAEANAYAEVVGADRLWLAAKLPPGSAFPDALLDCANTFLLDAYSKDLHGGTGRTANWPLFDQLSKRYQDKRWVLAGGLSPENISDAIQASGTLFIDVNSGIESAPGVKDMALLKRLLAVVAAQ